MDRNFIWYCFYIYVYLFSSYLCSDCGVDFKAFFRFAGSRQGDGTFYMIGSLIDSLFLFDVIYYMIKEKGQVRGDEIYLQYDKRV